MNVMSRRLFEACLSLTLLYGGPAFAQTPAGWVSLAATTSPTSGQAGITSINLTGSNFPSGSINASQVQISITPMLAGTGPAFTFLPSAVTALFGTSKRLTFTIPSSVTVSSSVSYSVSIVGQDSTGSNFSSINSSTLTIEPAPQVASLSPGSASPGQSLTVTISANYTNFTQGSTLASFGPDISVGGAPVGTPGPVTVTNQGAAIAQLAIASNAAAGVRSVLVQTGIQAVMSPAAFTVSSGGGGNPVPVPNVVNLTQTAATTSIQAAGFLVGTVALAPSSTVPQGLIISQVPKAGTLVNGGSLVDLVVSGGSTTNPPVSINVKLNRFILTAGGATTFTADPVDQSGDPVSGTPVCTITADPTTTGTIPTISSGKITTSSDTRGVYTLACSLQSLNRSSNFTVLLPTDNSVSTTRQATFADFSATTTNSLSLLSQIKKALSTGNAAEVSADVALLQSTLNAVDFDALDRAIAFAPEGGFPAEATNLPNFGINPTAQDAKLGSYLTSLVGALQNLTVFLQTTPLATLTASQKDTYNQLQATFSALISSLPSLNPSAFGVVANVDQEQLLFSHVLPQYYQALIKATIQYLAANSFMASMQNDREAPFGKGERAYSLPATIEDSGEIRLVKAALHRPRLGRHLGLAFQFGGLVEVEVASQIQMDLIQQLYWDYFAYLEKAAATLALRQAFQLWKGPAGFDGINSGASQSFLVFNAGSTIIEGENFSINPENNRVYLIGPDQINGIVGLANYIKGLYNEPPKDLNELDKKNQELVDLLKQVICLYDEAVQPPTDTSSPGLCIFGDSAACMQLVYNNGFRSVYQPPSGLKLPAPVIILVQNKASLSGSFSIGTFNFLPLASATPCK
ncbi:MAG: PASTA domain-containing protein [Acidobacteriota bacterium]|nr:PASTA domain-containing protein [Acidobacteriota bacterium]